MTCIFTYNITFPTVFFAHFVSASQQHSLSISRILTVNMYIAKTSKSLIAKIYRKNITLPVKRPSLAILTYEICKFAQLRPATLLKKDSDIGVLLFLSILRNF